MQILLKGYQCLRCGHQWKPRKKTTPVKCPACDSSHWQQPWGAEANGEDQAALLDLVEIPRELGKRKEPMIKGKGTPVWVLVGYYTKHNMTPEEISQYWDGEITPEEVRAAIAYWRKYPERVIDKLSED